MSKVMFVTNTAITGTTVVLSNTEVVDWENAIESIEGECDFTVMVGETEYTGAVTVADDQLAILLAFDQVDIAVPSFSCFNVECVYDDNDDTTPEYCTGTDAIDLEDNTRLAIVDIDGCLSGYVTYGDLKDAIIDEIKGSLTFCDLFPDGVPEGDLVVSDRIITVSSGCDLKSVSTSDISCD